MPLCDDLGYPFREEERKQYAELSAKLMVLLRQQPINVVGAALGEACAIFLGSHPDEGRQRAVDLFFDLIEQLIPVVVQARVAAEKAAQNKDKPLN